jgi:ElaB/YqjD/DUF883 family membrane-anchored ribosome-binding protein
MRKTAIPLMALLLLAVSTYAQVARDGSAKVETGVDWLSVGIGVVVGLVVGYLLGSRRKA